MFGDNNRTISRRTVLKNSAVISATAAAGGVVGAKGEQEACRHRHSNADDNVEGNVTCVVDDFEDGGITEYRGDTGSFTVQSSEVYEGDYALQGQTNHGEGKYKRIVSDAGLDIYPNQGDSFEFRTKLTRDDSGLTFFLFGFQDNRNHYRIVFQAAREEFRIVVAEGGELTQYSTPMEFQKDIWYQTNVDWGSDGTMTATLLDEGGDPQAEVSTDNTPFADGGIGFFNFNLGNPDTNYWDLCQITGNS